MRTYKYSTAAMFKDYPRLGEAADIRRGFTISPGSDRPVLGHAEAGRALQFCLRDSDFVIGGFEPSVRRYAHADGVHAKVLLPAAHDGSAWPIRAFTDLAALGATPDFLAILPRTKLIPAEALEAILNGPAANSYLNEFETPELTAAVVASVPLPRSTDYTDVVAAIGRHKELLGQAMDAVTPGEALIDALNDSLVRVDAAVLQQYDLAPWSEGYLLQGLLQRNAERRAGFEFSTWWKERSYVGGSPLHRYLASLDKDNKGPWILDAIEPLSERDWEAVSRWLP